MAEETGAGGLAVKRWLLLLQRVPLIKSPALLAPLLQETEELIRIFAASVCTAASKQRR